MKPYTQNLGGGGIAYLDEDERYHREDGPAIIYPDNHEFAGYKGWFLHGVQVGCNQQQWLRKSARLIKTNEDFLKLMKLKAFW